MTPPPPQAPAGAALDALARATRLLPDEPCWTIAHGLARDPATWRRELGEGLALGHDEAGLVFVCGAPGAAALGDLARALPRHALVGAAPSRAGALDGLAASRGVVEVDVVTLAEDADPPLALEGLAPLPVDAPLAHLPPALAAELDRLRRDRAVWSAWVDGVAVSFARATWRSPRWFDAAVDTLPGYRQLGLATMVAGALILDEARAGRAPAWAAPTDAPATGRLAAGLGLTARARLWLAAPSP